jgi:hypothetical protein
MSNKVKIIISVAVAVVFIGVGAYLYWSGAFQNLQKFNGQTGTEQTFKTPNGEFKGVVAAPGASPINEAGQVVNSLTGKTVDNTAIPLSPNAPQQSNAVSKEAIPTTAIKVTAMASGFSPNSFTVQRGAPVTVSVTSGDTFTYVFAFDDPSLQAVAVGIGPGETRIIAFNAPTKAGEYLFYNNVGPRRPSQISGKMIVK